MTGMVFDVSVCFVSVVEGKMKSRDAGYLSVHQGDKYGEVGKRTNTSFLQKNIFCFTENIS
ncbi:MAG: hypothetical protein LBJ92_02165 [Holosporales bacterium]|jgi:hypothetical protein|nr:hypothetical protein [Holosporales bacterium]